jgi:hypothetical protein
MLFIVCALACEAKPLISHFHLKSVEDPTPFSLYKGESMALIVSGVGKLQTAAAMGYLQGIMGNCHHAAWLNVGIAGHASLELGKGILAHQIIDQISGRSYYPTFVVDRPVETATVCTVEKPEMKYEENVVFDMEAAAFWGIASRFATAELIHCYKIISDNRQSGTSYLTKERVEQLVQAHMDPIERFIRSLQQLSQSLINLELSNAELKPFLKQWHFTSTQQFQLKRLLQRWKACTAQPLYVLWDEQLLTLQKSQHLLQYLEKKLQVGS